MAFDVRAYAKKIAESKPAGSGNPIRDGDFLLAIRRLSIKPSDKGSETWFIGEFFVIKAGPVDVAPDLITADRPLTNPNPVGSDCSMVVDLNSKMGPANVKEIAAAHLGKKHDELTEDDFFSFLSNCVDAPGTNTGQPLTGRVLSVKTTRKLVKEGKNAGKPAVRLNWGHVDQTQAEQAEIRALLTPKAS